MKAIGLGIKVLRTLFLCGDCTTLSLEHFLRTRFNFKVFSRILKKSIPDIFTILIFTRKVYNKVIFIEGG